jgi:hypothetical protein
MNTYKLSSQHQVNMLRIFLSWNLHVLIILAWIRKHRISYESFVGSLYTHWTEATLIWVVTKNLYWCRSVEHFQLYLVSRRLRKS